MKLPSFEYHPQIFLQRFFGRRFNIVGVGLGLVLVLGAVCRPESAAQRVPFIEPSANEWMVVGGNLANQRYSSLDQINTTDVKDMKAAWVVHTGSGIGNSKYSFEDTPIVQNGVMYVASGNDDVLALDAKTGSELWEYRSGIDQNIDSVCCGWDNRGVALGPSLLYLGQLDGYLVALDRKSGTVAWKTQVGDWHDKYSITSAPLYYDGVVYTGISGADFGVRGKLTALDANTGQELWHFWTIPGPGDFGGDTWPANSDAYTKGGASIWQTPSIDPDLGLIYFSTGNAFPDFNQGETRPGDDLFTASIVALDFHSGQYRWHFQEVHHDLWDYDAPSPTVLFDTTINGQSVKGLAEAGKTGWIYLLDRTNGKPLIGIDERPVPQDPAGATAATQPIPIGDAFVKQCGEMLPGWLTGCIFDYSTKLVKSVAPGPIGGDDWAPMSYDPQTGDFYVAGTNLSWSVGGAPVLPPLVGAHKNGTLTAIDAHTNTIVWQKPMPYMIGSGSGVMTTAGGIAFHGEPDGNFQAYDAKNGDLLWQWQTGAGADAPPVTYMIDGVQYVAIAAGGLQRGSSSARSDTVWAFSLNSKSDLKPFAAPTPPTTVVDFTYQDGQEGAAPVQTNKVAMVDFSFTPTQVEIKAGETVTWTNGGSQPHTATSMSGGGFDTGPVGPGGTYSLTFSQPGTWIYTCTPHPWMTGRVVVTDAAGNAPDIAPTEPNAVHP
jgi:quinohemoprotein ethanol dehydrogenase